MLTTPEAPPAGWLNIIPELLLVALSILTVAGNLAIPPISKLLSTNISVVVSVHIGKLLVTPVPVTVPPPSLVHTN